jgi:hypothetical protein
MVRYGKCELVLLGFRLVKLELPYVHSGWWCLGCECLCWGCEWLCLSYKMLIWFSSGASLVKFRVMNYFSERYERDWLRVLNSLARAVNGLI